MLVQVARQTGKYETYSIIESYCQLFSPIAVPPIADYDLVGCDCGAAVLRCTTAQPPDTCSWAISILLPTEGTSVTCQLHNPADPANSTFVLKSTFQSFSQPLRCRSRRVYHTFLWISANFCAPRLRLFDDCVPADPTIFE